jgi:hypothetical protein
MGWIIKCLKCTKSDNRKKLRVNNIVDLIENHTDESGWFICRCGKHGYIEKHFDLQEDGEVWNPYLRGVIKLGESGQSYQPFVFLVSQEPDGKVTGVWFSYYKDLRSKGGRLKLGYGPGGPPVLEKSQLLNLITQLAATRYLTKREVLSIVTRAAR